MPNNALQPIAAKTRLRLNADVKQQMKTSFLIAVLVGIGLVPPLASADQLCAVLRNFVGSVRPSETRAFTFHTLWGGDFNDVPGGGDTIYAKRCVHNDYVPAKMVCSYLMEHGAIEFSGNNVKRAVECLSPKTRFAPKFELHRASFSFSVGSDNRGSNVDMEFYEDSELGGMAFRVTADGY